MWRYGVAILKNGVRLIRLLCTHSSASLTSLQVQPSVRLVAKQRYEREIVAHMGERPSEMFCGHTDKLMRITWSAFPLRCLVGHGVIMVASPTAVAPVMLSKAFNFPFITVIMHLSAYESLSTAVRVR